MSSYPVPSCAVPVSAGMVVAVPAELLASPLKSGRNLGDADRSAVVIGGTERIRTCGAVVFCKVVAVAGAQVRRDGQVRAKGSPVHHATLGPLEEKSGTDVIGGTAGQAPLDARFVKGRRERLLARAFMIRVIVLMTLMPQARIGDVIAALAGDLALVPWARPWRPASARAAGDWRKSPGPVPLEELRDLVLGQAWREHRERGCPGAVTIGKKRPLKAGSLDGTLLRVPDTPANRAFFGTAGTGDDSGPYPCLRALPLTCCSCRTLFAMPHGPAGTAENHLRGSLARSRPPAPKEHEPARSSTGGRCQRGSRGPALRGAVSAVVRFRHLPWDPVAGPGWRQGRNDGGKGAMETGFALSQIDTTIPHPARMYYALLGGKDNYAADRQAVRELLRVAPEARDSARANRAFLQRAVRYLAGQAGILLAHNDVTGKPLVQSRPLSIGLAGGLLAVAALVPGLCHPLDVWVTIVALMAARRWLPCHRDRDLSPPGHHPARRTASGRR